MTNPITGSLTGSIERTFSLADAFVSVCPEDIWQKKFGGWPVWQQLYHGFTSIDFFLRPEGAPEATALFEHSVGDLKTSPGAAPAKKAMQEYMSAMQSRVREYATGLSDANLGQSNQGLSARFGKEMTHAATLNLIAGHIFYHLGSCDAALREHGHKGVF